MKNDVINRAEQCFLLFSLPFEMGIDKTQLYS